MHTFYTCYTHDLTLKPMLYDKSLYMGLCRIYQEGARRGEGEGEGREGAGGMLDSFFH